MTKKTHIRPADIRGYSRLAVDATLGLTRLVETMHHNIVRVPGPLGKYTEKPTRGITGLVYRSIQGTTRLVGGGINALLGQLLPLLEREPAASSAGREAVVAALNGVLGDHLAASANPLAIPMQLRQNGRPLALTAQDIAADVSAPSGKILLLVHGLCMNDLQWRRNGHDHGAALAAAGGYTPLYLHYNSGRHVSTNGRALAGMLETLLQAWPVPVEKLVIVGHSMGGLLARSACHYGRLAGHGWLNHLRQLVFLGTPHHGAPLERGGHWLEVLLGASPATAALARLGKLRSAGIMDLRHGCLVDEDWVGQEGWTGTRDRRRGLPLPAGVRCFAIGATLAARPGLPGARSLGDGLVPLDSALGRHPDPALDLGLPAARTWIARGMGHLDLLDRPEVYARIRKWLA